jgi:glycosyltransferase involved in cell wall biosynthesis
MPSVTVLMTTYNSASYIKEAIDSILNQTYRDFEFLIIDDGSTDNTEKIVDQFSDIRIKYIKIGHIGRSRSLNYGIERCQSALIAIMDSDDYAESDRLMKQFIFLDQNSDIDIVGSWASIVNSSNETSGTLRKPILPKSIKENILNMNGLSFSTSMIRFSNIHFKYFNEKLTFGEDLEWLYKNSFYNKYYNIPEKLIRLRQVPNSLSRNKNNNKSILYDQIREAIIENFKEIKDKNTLNKGLAFLEYYYGDNKIAKKYFFDLIIKQPIEILNIRYFISTLLIQLFGDSVRRSKIFLSITKIQRLLTVYLNYKRR